MGIYIYPTVFGNFFSVSGGTVTGNTYVSGSLTADTIYSGATELTTVINNLISQNQVIIPDDVYIWTATTGNKSYKIREFSGYSNSDYTILASHKSYITDFSDYSVILGGAINAIHALDGAESVISTIVGGVSNKLYHSDYSGIFSGVRNILGYNRSYAFGQGYQKGNTIIGGNNNKLYTSYYSNIFGGSRNLITGDTYTTDAATYNANIIGGFLNQIHGATNSIIVGGVSNLIKHTANGSVIVGGRNIIATTPYTVYVPNLVISNLTASTGTTSYVLVSNNNQIFKKSIVGGVNTDVVDNINSFTFNVTGGSFSNSSFSGNTNFNGNSTFNPSNGFVNINGGLQSTTITGNTLYSGSTDVSLLFGSSNQTNLNTSNITLLQSQLNTKVNRSGDTMTGRLTVPVLSGQSISATTLYSGSTDVSLLFGSASQVSFNTSNINLLQNQINTKVNRSGDTMTGGLIAPSVSGQTISGGTLYSGSTDLSLLFGTASQVASNTSNISLFQGQLNTKVNRSGDTMTGSLIAPSLSGVTISGSTLYSGSTELSRLFPTVLWVTGNTGSGSIRPNNSLNTINSTYSLVFGRNNNILGSGFYHVILGGTANTITTTTNRLNSILGGANNGISGTTIAGTVVGGTGNVINVGNFGGVFAGQTNTISGGGSRNTIVGGLSNTNSGNLNAGIFSSRGSVIQNTSAQAVIAGGIYNTITSSYNTGIFAGRSNTIISASTYSSIVGGSSNIIRTSSISSGIFVGSANTITSSSSNSVIIGGSGHTITSNSLNSVIIGGSNYTLTTSNTVMVPKLVIKNLPTTIQAANLYADDSGNIFASTTSISGATSNPDISYYRKSTTTLYTPFYNSQITATDTTDSTFDTDKIYLVPFVISKNSYLNEMAVYSNSVSSTNYKLAIYSSDLDQLPDTLIAQSIENNFDRIGKITSAFARILNAGLYFLAIFADKSFDIKSIDRKFMNYTLGHDENISNSVVFFSSEYTYSFGFPTDFKSGAILVAKKGIDPPSIWVRFSDIH